MAYRNEITKRKPIFAKYVKLNSFAVHVVLINDMASIAFKLI